MAKFSLPYTAHMPVLFALASISLLSACSESEELGQSIDLSDRHIVFHTTLPSVTTRSEILYNSIPYFKVTAFNPYDSHLLQGGVLKPHFENELIEVDPSLDRLISERCIWPEQGHESDHVTFFAFYPALYSGAELVNNSSESSFDYKLKGFTVNSDIASQVDFVTAYATGNMTDDLFRGISLPFKHQLSRIEVNAWGAHKSCDIEIAGIRIGGVGVRGTFAFDSSEDSGSWNDAATERGIVEYVFRPGDLIVSLPNVNSGAATTTESGAVSIMGSKIGEDDNCAMLIPGNYAGWKPSDDGPNTANNMFISVLLRITDITPTSGVKPKDPQRYPYHDLSQGADALGIDITYLAVDKASGEVLQRVYKRDGVFVANPSSSEAYILPEGADIREFGWAALSVNANWQPGKIYTYTLNYTLGIGLHDPEVETGSPCAGEPVISDKVAISYKVKDWQFGGGDEFDAPPY